MQSFFSYIFVGILATSQIFSINFCQKQSFRRCSSKYVFLKISQYSQENTCVGVNFYDSCRTPVVAASVFCIIVKFLQEFRFPNKCMVSSLLPYLLLRRIIKLWQEDFCVKIIMSLCKTKIVICSSVMNIQITFVWSEQSTQYLLKGVNIYTIFTQYLLQLGLTTVRSSINLFPFPYLNP